MWGMRTETIPAVIIGALGAIKKGLETYLRRIPGQISISELQKITLLGTAHILRRVSYQAKNWLPFSASGPWFGLRPKDYQQTLSENGFIIIIIIIIIIMMMTTRTVLKAHYT